MFAAGDGRSPLSRTAVSEITERLCAEYEAFPSWDLSEFEVIYLFVDGIAERLHLSSTPRWSHEWGPPQARSRRSEYHRIINAFIPRGPDLTPFLGAPAMDSLRLGRIAYATGVSDEWDTKPFACGTM